jgi:hypothetical protein
MAHRIGKLTSCWFDFVRLFLWRTRATRILLVVASLLVFITSSAAQSRSIETKLATQYFRQLKQTSDRDGGKTQGLTLYGPIMFVDPRSGNVVANQADLQHKLVPQDGVFVGTLPSEINTADRKKAATASLTGNQQTPHNC